MLTEPHLPVDSVFVAPEEADALYVKVGDTWGQGIRTDFGTLTLSYRGTLVLKGVDGRILTESLPLSAGSCAALPNMKPVGGVSIGANITVLDEGSCCAACARTPRCSDWAFKPTLTTTNCWLGRDIKNWTRSMHSVSGRLGSVLSLSTRGAKLYGRGGSPWSSTRLSASFASASMINRGTFVPYYWSSDGYSALGVVNTSRHNSVPISYSADRHRVSWAYQGAFELYFMPAPTLALGTRAYFQLIGRPRVPPLFAFGFIASRWGWKDAKDIDSTLARFRAGRFPLDAIILDFEWFANQSDYRFHSSGESWYDDFGYHGTVFPKPQQQLTAYHETFHVQVGAIRKPRLGNPSYLATARKNGWMAPPGGPERYADGRWISFTDPSMREWYSEHNQHYLRDGMDFWWNDEGENQYYTYYWWNVAQIAMLRASGRPRRRFYSLNRAFIPGMARLGATVWTGDIRASWKDLARTPGMMLNWALAGAPYVACDIGGFHGRPTPELLVRWYQLGAFIPTMRVHSTLSVTPHWPWLFGEREASVMRSALELRYRLVPYHYSLAHRMYRHHALWMRPLAIDFPFDAKVRETTRQWMDGDILVAPVVRNDSVKDVYLPGGYWYPLGQPSGQQGPLHIKSHAALEELPAFVRCGTVLPLAPVVQHTGALPGGPLEVQVYGGTDGAFELTEDDGEGVGYEEGKVCITRLTWHESSRTLSWHREGVAAAGPGAFTALTVTLFEPNGITRSHVQQLSQFGFVKLPRNAPHEKASFRGTGVGRTLAAALPQEVSSANEPCNLGGWPLVVLFSFSLARFWGLGQ